MGNLLVSDNKFTTKYAKQTAMAIMLSISGCLVNFLLSLTLLVFCHSVIKIRSKYYNMIIYKLI